MKEEKNVFDVIVIGGGAAGLMAAGTAAQQGKNVLLVERNERTGRKILVTGKGRCNVTNRCTEIGELTSHVPVNGRFLFGAFSRFMPADTMDFFEELGVQLKVERGNRVFPESDRAMDIADALRRFIDMNDVTVTCARAEEIIVEDSSAVGVRTVDGEELYADSVILATGGLSYPQTGSTGDGYKMAEMLGHTIVEPKPSLVPLNAHDGFCSQLQGLALRNIEIKVTDTEKNRVVYKDFGEMLFTHFGVSGPVILSASSHMRDMKPKKYVISIDLKPALTHEKLDSRVLRDFSENINRNFINSLNSLLPKKLVPVVVKRSGISPGLKTNQVTKEQRARLVELLKDFTVTVTGFRPIDEAVITSGGIKVSEIDPKTMESKIVKGLYFAGEIIDADAYTGGFNLQIAFSTGRLAGMNA